VTPVRQLRAEVTALSAATFLHSDLTFNATGLTRRRTDAITVRRPPRSSAGTRTREKSMLEQCINDFTATV